MILSTSLSIGCDTSDSTWGYCSDDLSGWYLDDAASWDSPGVDGGPGWTVTGGNVCPGGSVSVIKTNPIYVAPPEPTYYYVGPVRFEVAPAAYTMGQCWANVSEDEQYCETDDMRYDQAMCEADPVNCHWDPDTVQDGSGPDESRRRLRAKKEGKFGIKRRLQVGKKGGKAAFSFTDKHGI